MPMGWMQSALLSDVFAAIAGGGARATRCSRMAAVWRRPMFFSRLHRSARATANPRLIIFAPLSKRARTQSPPTKVRLFTRIEELTSLAAAKGRSFLFESTVMDGVPIFALFRDSLPVVHLRGFRGILNSTTNVILSGMEDGLSFDESLARAQQIGVAETDPSNDIEGWDAAVKVAALITVLMGVPIRLDEIQREGIGKLEWRDCARCASGWQALQVGMPRAAHRSGRDRQRPSGAGTLERSDGLGRGNVLDRVF